MGKAALLTGTEDKAGFAKEKRTALILCLYETMSKEDTCQFTIKLTDPRLGLWRNREKAGSVEVCKGTGNV